MIKVLILLYLIIGVFFDMKVAKSAEGTTSDRAILVMIHIILILMWPFVCALVVHTAATKIDTNQSNLEPKPEEKKEEEQK